MHYPIALRPEFLAEGGAYAVVDLSEGGMRCEVKALQPLPELGAVLEGVIRLKRGESMPVRGTVVRIGVAFMALAFDAGVPFRIMLEEQRWLIQRNKLYG